jgi:hypothetical protein
MSLVSRARPPAVHRLARVREYPAVTARCERRDLRRWSFNFGGTAGVAASCDAAAPSEAAGMSAGTSARSRWRSARSRSALSCMHCDVLRRRTTRCNAERRVATQDNTLQRRATCARSRSALSCAAGAVATFAGHRRLAVGHAAPSSPSIMGRDNPTNTPDTQATTRSWRVARTALATGRAGAAAKASAAPPTYLRLRWYACCGRVDGRLGFLLDDAAASLRLLRLAPLHRRQCTGGSEA